jgi:hypothetical protein
MKAILRDHLHHDLQFDLVVLSPLRMSPLGLQFDFQK